MESITLHVEGMSCGHCVKAVEESVSKLQGISTVKVDLDSGSVGIEYNKESLNLETIKETIEDQGYDVKN